MVSLAPDENKELVINYLKERSYKGFIKIYAFVIMPNHVHFIWQQFKNNGKETPQGSFSKYTAHQFLKTLKQNGTSGMYEVTLQIKSMRSGKEILCALEYIAEKQPGKNLDYIHFNPVSGKGKLAKDDLGYYYSSARFYETGMDEFGCLHNLYNVFDGD